MLALLESVVSIVEYLQTNEIALSKKPNESGFYSCMTEIKLTKLHFRRKNLILQITPSLNYSHKTSNVEGNKKENKFCIKFEVQRMQIATIYTYSLVQ